MKKIILFTLSTICISLFGCSGGNPVGVYALESNAIAMRLNADNTADVTVTLGGTPINYKSSWQKESYGIVVLNNVGEPTVIRDGKYYNNVSDAKAKRNGLRMDKLK